MGLSTRNFELSASWFSILESNSSFWVLLNPPPPTSKVFLVRYGACLGAFRVILQEQKSNMPASNIANGCMNVLIFNCK